MTRIAYVEIPPPPSNLLGGSPHKSRPPDSPGELRLGSMHRQDNTTAREDVRKTSSVPRIPKTCAVDAEKSESFHPSPLPSSTWLPTKTHIEKAYPSSFKSERLLVYPEEPDSQATSLGKRKVEVALGGAEEKEKFTRKKEQNGSYPRAHSDHLNWRIEDVETQKLHLKPEDLEEQTLVLAESTGYIDELHGEVPRLNADLERASATRAIREGLTPAPPPAASGLLVGAFIQDPCSSFLSEIRQPMRPEESSHEAKTLGKKKMKASGAGVESMDKVTRKREQNRTSQRAHRDRLNRAIDHLERRMPHLKHGAPQTRAFVLEESARYVDQLHDEVARLKAELGEASITGALSDESTSTGCMTIDTQLRYVHPSEVEPRDEEVERASAVRGVRDETEPAETGMTNPKQQRQQPSEVEPENEKDLAARNQSYWSSGDSHVYDALAYDLELYERFPQLFLPISPIQSLQRAQRWYAPISPGVVWLQ